MSIFIKTPLTNVQINLELDLVLTRQRTGDKYGIWMDSTYLHLLRIATMNGIIVATGKHDPVMWDYAHLSVRGIR